MNIQNSPYLSALQQPQGVKNPKNTQHLNTQMQGASSFGTVLEEKIQEKQKTESAQEAVKFSKHALNRLSQRGISLSQEQMMRLAQGVDKASGKGIKEPLVLIDDLAFIVSTDKKTVITAVGQDQTEENIFTNIDGAVIN